MSIQSMGKMAFQCINTTSLSIPNNPFFARTDISVMNDSAEGLLITISFRLFANTMVNIEKGLYVFHVRNP